MPTVACRYVLIKGDAAALWHVVLVGVHALARPSLEARAQAQKAAVGAFHHKEQRRKPCRQAKRAEQRNGAPHGRKCRSAMQ
jgi:hypothetical protein